MFELKFSLRITLLAINSSVSCPAFAKYEQNEVDTNSWSCSGCFTGKSQFKFSIVQGVQFTSTLII